MVSYKLSDIPIVIRSRWNRFIKSILFYPILFAVSALVLFLITSSIDHSFPTGYSIDVGYIDPLVFTGSPDAARAILSAIATGWATILGVAFSVTLITLQLSVSKYISHLVNRFEGDKINQLSLGWFIFTVTYSLLVLKTVRIEESSINLAPMMMNMSSMSIDGNQQLESSIFTPIIGVNLAILISIVGLFMLVLYLHNISSYLKPNILISKLIDQILGALKPYEKRISDQSSNDKNTCKIRLFEIIAPHTGILAYIDWRKVSENLMELALRNQKDLWIEYSKSIGDWIKEQDNIAIVYEFDEFIASEKKTWSQIPIEKRISLENGERKKDRRNQHSKDGISKTKQKFLRSMEITNDRDLTHDPLFGIEVLRSVAVKSAELGDTDVIKSCITGLFRILHYALIHKDIIGIPFTLTTEDSKRKINKMKFQEIENNNIKENHIDTNNEPLQTSTLKAIINPKEILLDSVILVELSVIIDKILITRNVPIINHIVSEYIAQCNSLVRQDKHQEFRMLTDWCSGQLSLVSKALPPHLSSSFIEQLLIFKKDLEKGQPQFAKLFDIYMKNIISIS
ncbi:MAG TPA: DUF2254 family protein [Candidatus Nitrosocosmicus sp.]|nr:DUF2254 family protein [Candidatus Nitrosocosmicus sp.]